ncbi:MAG: hypothetical protein OER91_02275 [Gammaproteobacteria bacterium]|nr:hypothetical protein [Gammaproteobacteria bacterium]
MMDQAMDLDSTQQREVSGDFLTVDGERWYAIRNIDRMKPFFISVVSNADHWLFVSSTGGLTAGRVSPGTALFPYVTVDKIHDSASHTGCQTVIRCSGDSGTQTWEPFNPQQHGRYEVSRNLYKNVLGNKLCFEELNHDLKLVFRYTWSTSDEYGFVRHAELLNSGATKCHIDVLDGFRNLLPAGTPPHTQANASNLVDAYKWTELDVSTGLAMYALYSGISDRAEPCESLRANTVFSLGLEKPTILLSETQVDLFRDGAKVAAESRKRGLRGAYYVSASFDLPAKKVKDWTLVADIERSQAEVIDLQYAISDRSELAREIQESVEHGSGALAAIIASADGLQSVDEEMVSAHHQANVLFNLLRGGIFDDHYHVSAADLRRTIEHFNSDVYERASEFLNALPESLSHNDLLVAARDSGDQQLERLCLEYLPIRFGRRHGDPSRPWNYFNIRLKDADGNPLLSYEGNWRDIFQNWEALLLSYPEFIESVIAKFVNASTADGYNPYRITKDGIDWEIEDEADPWSYIGYWGDHQIIYLQKLLELSVQFHPERLGDLLHRPVFSYADVPYRIRSFEDTWRNPKDTVVFDGALAARIESDERTLGADAKLLRDPSGGVCNVTLLEKLLVTLLAKLGNTVIGGGVWLNTQRPEWNDANNALVGQGLSMVTLCYMRRFISFLQDQLGADTTDATLSAEVARWLREIADCLAAQRALTATGIPSPEDRFAAIEALGTSSSRYRARLYENGVGPGSEQVPIADITAMLDDALAIVEWSIRANRRDDGLYHAYNLLVADGKQLSIGNLYPMLEGQVAALSSGALKPGEVCAVIEALFDSEIFRPDQQSFMLYPDRALPSFLEKNVIQAAQADAIPLLMAMRANGDERLVIRDQNGNIRFHADFINAEALGQRLDALRKEYPDAVDASRDALMRLYEQVFDHRSFTGRSGGMFGFEGLGCIYWHMVSKLLLAVQENYFHAAAIGAADTKKLGELYFRVREGLGFNKTPEEYGAFPADPYSHTPGHSGARQPGMTGQVKEEVLARFGELGVRVIDGTVTFDPSLLRRREFRKQAQSFTFLGVDGTWQTMEVPVDGLAFTWCQVPVRYVLDDAAAPQIEILDRHGAPRRIDSLNLPADDLDALTARTGDIREITVSLSRNTLFSD